MIRSASSPMPLESCVIYHIGNSLLLLGACTKKLLLLATRVPLRSIHRRIALRVQVRSPRCLRAPRELRPSVAVRLGHHGGASVARPGAAPAVLQPHVPLRDGVAVLGSRRSRSRDPPGRGTSFSSRLSACRVCVCVFCLRACPLAEMALTREQFQDLLL